MKNKTSLVAAVLSFLACTLSAQAKTKTTADYDQMTVAQARQYMVMLINMDRRKNGLGLVSLDGTATISGQRHTDYLLSVGAKGHYEGDGSKPATRYNAAGGTDFVAENVARFMGGDSGLAPDPNARFTRMSIYELEVMLMNSPGHRANILDKNRTHVGIGLSQARDKFGVVLAQEFVNKYGNIGRIPSRIYRGQTISVSGALQSVYKFDQIVVKREEFPKRMTVQDMNQTTSYQDGSEKVTTIFSRQATSSGSSFSASIEIAREWQPGLYYFIVWAKDSRNDEHIPVSILTASVI